MPALDLGVLRRGQSQERWSELPAARMSTCKSPPASQISQSLVHTGVFSGAQVCALASRARCTHVSVRAPAPSHTFGVHRQPQSRPDGPSGSPCSLSLLLALSHTLFRVFLPRPWEEKPSPEWVERLSRAQTPDVLIPGAGLFAHLQNGWFCERGPASFMWLG